MKGTLGIDQTREASEIAWARSRRTSRNSGLGEGANRARQKPVGRFATPGSAGLCGGDGRYLTSLFTESRNVALNGYAGSLH